MLYYVKLNSLIIFKGNFYACTDYVESREIKSPNLKIVSRK